MLTPVHLVAESSILDYTRHTHTLFLSLSFSPHSYSILCNSHSLFKTYLLPAHISSRSIHSPFTFIVFLYFLLTLSLLYLHSHALLSPRFKVFPYLFLQTHFPSSLSFSLPLSFPDTVLLLTFLTHTSTIFSLFTLPFSFFPLHYSLLFLSPLSHSVPTYTSFVFPLRLSPSITTHILLSSSTYTFPFFLSLSS